MPIDATCFALTVSLIQNILLIFKQNKDAPGPAEVLVSKKTGHFLTRMRCVSRLFASVLILKNRM